MEVCHLIDRFLAQWTRMYANLNLSCHTVHSSVPIKCSNEHHFLTQLDLPNSVHAYQTAERIRAEHPEPAYECLVFVGFVHDLGKVMGVWGEPQVCVPLPSPVHITVSLRDRERLSTVHTPLQKAPIEGSDRP